MSVSTPSQYGWITNPPWCLSDSGEVGERVALFLKNVAAWGPVGGDGEYARRKSARVDSAQFIAGLMMKQLEGNRPAFEYQVAGSPLALMQLHLNRGVMEIKNLVTHHGSEGAGGRSHCPGSARCWTCRRQASACR